MRLARAVALSLLVATSPVAIRCDDAGVFSQLDVRNNAERPVYVRVDSFTYLVPAGAEGVVEFFSGPTPASQQVDVLDRDCGLLGSVEWPRDETGSTVVVSSSLVPSVVAGITATGASQEETGFQESLAFCPP